MGQNRQDVTLGGVDRLKPEVGPSLNMGHFNGHFYAESIEAIKKQRKRREVLSRSTGGDGGGLEWHRNRHNEHLAKSRNQRRNILEFDRQTFECKQ